MNREFKITIRPDHDPLMQKARLILEGDGIWAPQISISVCKWDDLGLGVYVDAYTYTGEEHTMNAVHRCYDSIKEGWDAFQTFRSLLGLKGV